MSKKTIYVDMDDTIADFVGSEVFKDGFDVAKMYEPGFFRNLKPIPGALVGVRQLIRMGFDVQILSQPVAESAHSYQEKVEWIGMYFPELINKINLTQDKGLFKGDFLIDDNATKWKDRFEANGGKFIHFDVHNPENSWILIVMDLKKSQSSS
jgi:5'(3')-deoxyribonucleotidase